MVRLAASSWYKASVSRDRGWRAAIEAGKTWVVRDFQGSTQHCCVSVENPVSHDHGANPQDLKNLEEIQGFGEQIGN